MDDEEMRLLKDRLNNAVRIKCRINYVRRFDELMKVSGDIVAAKRTISGEWASRELSNDDVKSLDAAIIVDGLTPTLLRLNDEWSKA